ncbi:hypothetical protein I79_004188 [Cricetulus griseus]|uniref:Uncharacterized protein n=1 Tax=Cricetulus griseus TaxID=10029 RepID=G3H1Y9_CRIGR|nr:hypothetical protein I79_004188 [Cricetulus griseus]
MYFFPIYNVNSNKEKTVRLYEFQEKNSLRYITRFALGKRAYITNTNGEGLLQNIGTNHTGYSMESKRQVR